MTSVARRPVLDFTLPRRRVATRPPEHRGLARDEVRLLVARPSSVHHARFRDLPAWLAPGDVVVVNTSGTRAAALDATWRGRPVTLHLSTRRDDGRWVVELRRPDDRGPVLAARPGDRLDAAGGLVVTLVQPDGPGHEAGVRLWQARVAAPDRLGRLLRRHGRPISYGHLDRPVPLEDYQTVFAREPGSAEMASAGRPFTPVLVTRLVSRGIDVAPLRLDAGVSSLEAHELPRPERYEVPAATAARVNLARATGGRVVAVGTTVTRALETVATPDGTVRPGAGWTDLVLGPDRPARAVDGLVTGWHEPGASHLSLLEAVAGRELVMRAYETAVAGPYLWHEFGDSCLFLP